MPLYVVENTLLIASVNWRSVLDSPGCNIRASSKTVKFRFKVFACGSIFDLCQNMISITDLLW
jgi:hypothetical protein